MEFIPHKFTLDNKKIHLYESSVPNVPIIYLNSFMDVDKELLSEIEAENLPSFSLVTINNLDWNKDMSPWFAAPFSKDDKPCTGGADEYLELLIEKIIPAVEADLASAATWRGLAGYSLAGLFAVYSIYKTELFERIAAMSASLWFPDFTDYMQTHEILKDPQFIYLSLGDREDKTNNVILKPVLINTEEAVNYFRGLGIKTEFVLNKGGHHTQPVKRTVSGIKALCAAE